MTPDVALMVYSLGGGGVERVRIHLAEALEKRGLVTEIVVARVQGPYRSHVPAGVGLVDLRGSSWREWLGALTLYLQSRQPRVLLAAMETAGVLALWARRRSGVPTRIVVSSHIEFSQHICREPKLIKRLLLPRMVRQLYGSADGIVAVSHGVADDLARFASLPRSRIRVIFNPVVTDALADAADQKVPHEWFADDEIEVILGAGRLCRQKAFHTLVKAFFQVRKDRASIRLMILGEGEERESLEKLVRKLGLQDSVEMPGFVGNPFAYMARASVFVLSSAWEGLPGVVIQALACGCPVVSTDCRSGPREILEDGRYGRLVPVGDHEALAQGILDTLDDPPDLALLRRRAMDFHVDRIVDQYLDVMGLSSCGRG